MPLRNPTTSSGGGGSATTSASDLTSGTLPDARLSANVTLQGNAFNGASQLAQYSAAAVAQGTITMSGVSTTGQTFTVLNTLFTWRDTAIVPTDVANGATIAEAVTNIAAALNFYFGDALATADTDAGTVLIIASTSVGGSSGNALEFSPGDSANMTMDGAGYLGGTNVGLDPHLSYLPLPIGLSPSGSDLANNSTTLIPTALRFPVANNTLAFFRFSIPFTGVSSAGLKVQLAALDPAATFGATTGVYYTFGNTIPPLCVDFEPQGTSSVDSSTALAASTGISNGILVIEGNVSAFGVANNGTMIVLSFAQETAQAQDTYPGQTTGTLAAS